MRVVMTSLGAMGDVEPFVALADELRHHGHETVFALPAHLLPNARRRGFDGIQLGSERLSELYQAATRAYEYGEASEEEALYYAALMEAAPQAFQDLAGLCSQSDLLISMSVMPLGRMIHELTGIPFISVQIQHPNDSIEIPAELNGFRAQLGLPPVEDPSLHGISPQMMLVAIAPELLPAGYNPPPHYHVTGFFLPEQEDWQPDPALAAFLEAGPPPIVITLGSIMHHDPASVTNLFLEAIQKVGCRAIIQRGWTGLAQGSALPDKVYAVDYVPHAWLFPRAACVVYHGGGGTTAAALRAGVPTIIIPSNAGVDAWAEQANTLGCVGAIIPYRSLTVERLSEAIRHTLAEPRYREIASEIGGRLNAEPGVQLARRLIENFMADVSSQPQA